MNKKPTKALLKLGKNKIYPIIKIHWQTQMVALQEKPNVINTVDFKNVDFIIE